MPAPAERCGRLIVGSLCAALLSTAWALDPFAEAAFDAPKRLLGIVFAVIGATADHADSWPDWRWSGYAQSAVLFLALGLIGTLISTMLAAHADSAWASLRTVILFALFLPLAASRALGGRRGLLVYWAAGAAALVNALLSLMQASGWDLPLLYPNRWRQLVHYWATKVMCPWLAHWVRQAFAWALNASSCQQPPRWHWCCSASQRLRSIGSRPVRWQHCHGGSVSRSWRRAQLAWWKMYAPPAQRCCLGCAITPGLRFPVDGVEDYRA
jgi:hypothetical protein